MTIDIPGEIPHVDDLEPDMLGAVDYVRDDDTVYHVLPNHKGIGQYDIVEVEEE